MSISEAIASEDVIKVLKLLAPIAKDGLSQDELASATGWPNWKVNDILCKLPVGTIKSHKVKYKGNRKVVKYYLKTEGERN